ncbi:MAG: hypothetical protein IKT65_00100 [Clostridia bacterium]|nr:hypothetical protein [Clostridia bacterium]
MLLFSIVAFFSVERAISPSVMSLAKTTLEGEISKCINDSVMQVIQSENVEFETMYRTVKNTDDSISAIFINASEANRIKALITERVIENIEKIDTEIKIPIGNLTDNILFSGKGRCINVDVIAVSSVQNRLENKTKDSGINQTHLSSYIVINASVAARIGGKSVNAESYSEIMLCDTVIVGKVPDSFVSIDVLDEQTRTWLQSYKR